MDFQFLRKSLKCLLRIAALKRSTKGAMTSPDRQAHSKKSASSKKVIGSAISKGATQ